MFILLGAFLIDVGKSDKMKRANVKFVPGSSAGCVVDHTYDSEIENSSNSEEEEDEEKETESQHDDNYTPIIMTTNEKRKNQQYTWKRSVSQGAVETEDTHFSGKNFPTDNTDIESPFHYFRKFFDKEMVCLILDNTNL